MRFSPLSVVIQGSATEATARPHPALAGHVSLFWELRFAAGEHQVRSLPDGCTDLVFDLGHDPAVARVSGPQLEARQFVLTGPTALFGVRLLPGAAPALLGGPVGPGDLWAPLERWVPTDQAVGRAATLPARIEAAEAWLAGRLLGQADPALAPALAAIFASAGTIRIESLAEACALGQRALNRLFTTHVGLGPKRFCRVVRFQHALRRLDGPPDWAALAADLGYFDQAHLIREFRGLFGCTPGQALALVRGGGEPEAPGQPAT